MPQTFDRVINPWAQQGNKSTSDPSVLYGLDPQRSDLFTIDFSAALTAIQTILRRVTAQYQLDPTGVGAALYSYLPTREQLTYYPVSVDFPERKVGVEGFRRHDVPYPHPGYDDELGAISVSWMLDCGTDDFARSQILAFLRSWLAVTRAGRAGQSESELSLDLNTASASGTGFIPDFRHDFVVSLWRGFIHRQSEGADSIFVGASDNMELSQRWLVKRGWLAGIQMPGLRTNQAASVAEVRTTFYADTIVEI